MVATCIEVRVGRGTIPHILRKMAILLKPLKSFTNVLIDIQDLDKSHALALLFTPPSAFSRIDMIVGCLSRGVLSILGQLGICWF